MVVAMLSSTVFLCLHQCFWVIIVVRQTSLPQFPPPVSPPRHLALIRQLGYEAMRNESVENCPCPSASSSAK